MKKRIYYRTGDTLVAVDPCVMNLSGRASLIVGKEYPIIDTGKGQFCVRDEDNSKHWFNRRGKQYLLKPEEINESETLKWMNVYLEVRKYIINNKMSMEYVDWSMCINIMENLYEAPKLRDPNRPHTFPPLPSARPAAPEESE